MTYIEGLEPNSTPDRTIQLVTEVVEYHPERGTVSIRVFEQIVEVPGDSQVSPSTSTLDDQ